MNFQQVIINMQLLDAIANKDHLKIEELLKQGADVNFANLHDKNNTPLHYAASANSPESVKLLIKHGADAKVQNSDGQTPIDLLMSSPESAQQNLVMMENHFGPSPSIPTYFKRPGTASILGQWYESKLLALVLFRALHWERISSFFLATNVDDAGAFDDLVIRYNDEGVDRLVFLQAKHKLGKSLNLKDILESSGESGDFSLVKYFKSFLFIKLRCHESNQSAIFKNISKDTVVEFIIFTTLKLESRIFEEFGLKSQGTNNEKESLFYTCSTGRVICMEGLLKSMTEVASKWYKEMLVEILARNWFSSKEPANLVDNMESFMMDIKTEESSFEFLKLCYEKVSSITIPNEDRKRFNSIKPKIQKLLESDKFQAFKMSTDDCNNLPKEFFCKLRFYTEQSSEAEVEQIIKTEMPNFYPASGDVNLIFQMYHLAVQQWWLQTGNVPFQTKSSKLFEESKTTIEKGSLLENLHLISMGKLQVYKNELCPEKLGEALKREVQRFVDDQNSHTLPIVGGLIESSCVKLVEYLKSKDEEQVNFKFVNTDVANFKDKIGQLATSDGAINDFLVFAHKGQIERKVIESLSRNFRKIIMVTDKEMEPAVASSSSSVTEENLPVVQAAPAGETDQDSYRNRRKAFLRNSRKNIRSLLLSMGEQLIDLNVNKK